MVTAGAEQSSIARENVWKSITLTGVGLLIAGVGCLRWIVDAKLRDGRVQIKEDVAFRHLIETPKWSHRIHEYMQLRCGQAATRDPGRGGRSDAGDARRAAAARRSAHQPPGREAGRRWW